MLEQLVLDKKHCNMINLLHRHNIRNLMVSRQFLDWIFER